MPIAYEPGERALRPNDVCFCGSGVKYKKCCRVAGKVALVKDHPAAPYAAKKKTPPHRRGPRQAAAGDEPPPQSTATIRAHPTSMRWYDKALLMFFAVSATLKLLHYIARIDITPLGWPAQLFLMIHPVVLLSIGFTLCSRQLRPDWTRTVLSGRWFQFGIFCVLTAAAFLCDVYLVRSPPRSTRVHGDAPRSKV